MKELTIDATTENVDEAIAFVDEEMEKCNFPMKGRMQIDVAIDELFSNIARYAYNPKLGACIIRFEVVEDPMAVKITFLDNGIPFNPLESKNPDISLSAEDRDIGGLGIFVVKKSMDKIDYEYKNGQNILTIRKNF